MTRIAAPITPIRELGWLPAYASRPLYPASIEAPKVPLHQLGWVGATPIGPAVTSVAAPIAGAITSSLVADTAAGAWAGPIGAGVGAVIGIIAGLWAAHDARVAGAKTENAAVASAVVAFDGSLKAIFQAANSGQLAPSDAVSALQQTLGYYWSSMAPYQSGPGRADASHGGAACGSVKCNKSCTAGCCVGCLDLTPAITAAIGVFQAGGGTITVPQVYGDKYGLKTRSSYTLTYTPPSVAQSVTGELAALTSGSGGSILPLLLLGVAAFLVLK